MATQITSQNRDQRLGQLTHSAGNIVLAASTIHIGALQYTTDTSKSVALPSLIANTRYQVYAVDNGASDVALVISTNENSVGPASYNKWKLVGSLYAGATAFGSFANIKGSPRTESIAYTPPLTGLTGPTGIVFFWRRDGKRIYVWGTVDSVGTVTATDARVDLPTNLIVDTINLDTGKTPIGHVTRTSNAAATAILNDGLIFWNTTYTNAMSLGRLNQGAGNTNIIQAGWDTFTSSSFGLIVTASAGLPITGWSNTPIEDL